MILNKVKITTLAAATMFSIFVNCNTAYAQTEITNANFVNIIVNGEALTKEANPIIINNNLFLPVRAIGDALNAKTTWDENSKRITLFNNDNYVTLKIGEFSMIYGKFENANGQINYKTINTEQLTQPAIIYNDRTVLPVRATANIFNATVSWDNLTNTATIISVKQPPTPVATPIVSNEPIVSNSPIITNAPTLNPTVKPTQNPAFSSSQFFQNTTAKRIFDMNTFNNKFALVLYDSSNLDELEQIYTIKKATESINFNFSSFGKTDYSKLFAFDINNLTNDNSSETIYVKNLLKNYIKNYPTIIYHYKDGSVITQSNNFDTSTISNNLENMINENTPTKPTSTPEITTPSETTTDEKPQPTICAYDSPYLEEVWTYYANNKLANGSKFIYVTYNSEDGDYNELFQIIKDSAEKTKTMLYVTDYSKDPNHTWDGQNSTGTFVANPTVYFVDGATIVPVIRPKDSDKLAIKIKDFYKN